MTELKKTKQREAILSVVEKADSPVSAEYIYDRIKELFPHVAISTVYRNLDKFLEAGLLKKESFNDGIMWFSPARQHGHFIVCTGCGAKLPLPHCPLSAMEDSLAKETGFQISGHHITLYGKCPNCQKKFHGTQQKRK